MYHAVVRRDGDWWIGWIEEVPGVNSQGATREELLENLREALREAIEMNREEARKAAGTPFEEVAIQPDEEFDRAARHVLETNRELYRRLS
jgi:predicted RNase H-like HicB family nuclease